MIWVISKLGVRNDDYFVLLVSIILFRGHLFINRYNKYIQYF
jgi:hypothetical protein